jgi:hypothetical protein
MTNDIIIDKAIQEIETKTWGVIEQFLEVHKIVYADGKPVIARIDKENVDGTVIVYFSVKDEPFYFAIYFDTLPEIAIRWMGTAPNNCVYFAAFSNEMSFTQLAALTKLQPTGGWTIGETQKPGGTLTRKNSKIMFEPNTEPGEFEDKLIKLLDYLEQDKKGVKALTEKAEGYIQVTIEFHNGNTMLGGSHISKECITRMSALNLEIDFDLYAAGRSFKVGD